MKSSAMMRNDSACMSWSSACTRMSVGWRGASRYYDPKYVEAFKLELKAVRKVREEYGSLDKGLGACDIALLRLLDSLDVLRLCRTHGGDDLECRLLVCLEGVFFGGHAVPFRASAPVYDK